MPETMDCVYYVGTHPYSYRSGEPAAILGVGTFRSPETGEPPRACFHVRYADGKHDYCPISDYGNYKILTFDEVRYAYRELTFDELRDKEPKNALE